LPSAIRPILAVVSASSAKLFVGSLPKSKGRQRAKPEGIRV